MRTFIAIDLPETIHSALAEQQAAFRALASDARWTRPEGVHLTLDFLGEIPETQVNEVINALGALERFEPFAVEVKGFGFFPDARRPRVFWAGVEAPATLAELAERVEASMEKLGFAREGRPFSPHLTLARFKIPRPHTALSERVERQRELSLGRFDVTEFFLYESRLSPQGSEYRKVAKFPKSLN